MVWNSQHSQGLCLLLRCLPSSRSCSGKSWKQVPTSGFALISPFLHFTCWSVLVTPVNASGWQSLSAVRSDWNMDKVCNVAIISIFIVWNMDKLCCVVPIHTSREDVSTSEAIALLPLEFHFISGTEMHDPFFANRQSSDRSSLVWRERTGTSILLECTVIILNFLRKQNLRSWWKDGKGMLLNIFWLYVKFSQSCHTDS